MYRAQAAGTGGRNGEGNSDADEIKVCGIVWFEAKGGWVEAVGLKVSEMVELRETGEMGEMQNERPDSSARCLSYLPTAIYTRPPPK